MRKEELMEYLKFTTEVSNLLEANKKLNHDQADRMIFDKWIAERKYAGLVNYILENWDSGNCVEYMKPLTEILITEHEYDLHHQIWSKTVKRQVEILFRHYPAAKKCNHNYDSILKMNTKGFNEFKVESYTDLLKTTSFFLKRVMASLDIWENELNSGSQKVENVHLISDSIKKMIKPPKHNYNRSI